MTAPKRDQPGGLPVTADFSDIAGRLAPRKRTINESALTRDPTSAWGPMNTVHQLKVAESMRVENPTPSAVDFSKADFDGTPLQLDVTQILLYDKNPRQFQNAAFEDIKAGLRANGFVGALAVTRRRSAPGEPYMLCAGANTTVEALRQLFAETGDQKFRRVNCVYHAFVDEQTLLAQHLAENLNRGDMLFWEVAQGVCRLIDMLNETLDRSLTLNELEVELPKRGVTAKRSTISFWQFADKHLQQLGAATKELKFEDAKLLQPSLNLLRKLAKKFGLDDASFWTDVVDPTLASAGAEFEQSNKFSATSTYAACEVALAEHVGGGESVASIRGMLAMLSKNPACTLADLRMPRRSAVQDLVTTTPENQPVAPAHPTSGAPEHRASAEPAQVIGDVQISVARDATRHIDNPPSMAAQDNEQTASGPSAFQFPPSATARGADKFEVLPGVPNGADAMDDLRECLEELVIEAGVEDCIRWWPDMPYGFFMEIPRAELHPVETLPWASPEMQQRRRKQITWWLLVRLSGQAEARCENLMDKSSAFYLDATDEYNLAAVRATAIGGPDSDFEVINLLTNSNDIVMYWLLKVIDRMRVVNGRMPRRWPPADPYDDMFATVTA